jgi:hypothetical protein
MENPGGGQKRRINEDDDSGGFFWHRCVTSGGSMQGSGNTVRLKNNDICSGDDIDVDGDLCAFVNVKPAN